MALGEVARALSLFPLPCSVLCARGPRGPDATRGALGSGVCGLHSRAGRRCGESRAPWRSRRVVATPQLLRGRWESRGR